VGNSVGGNMAAVTALRAKLENGPNVKLQILLWPVTDADFDTKSYHQYAEDRFLTRNMMIWFWDHYISKEKRDEIYASPLKASKKELEALPPTIVQTAENDVLRSEGEAYARKLDEAGVEVTLMRIQGMIHDYGLLNPLAHVPAVQAALRQAAMELNHALK
jgi:acetyl esterase/lipase